jgi:CheY-like chemotaxis protein
VRPILAIDPNIPRSIVTVVQKAMELNPDKRYQRAADMLNDLRLVQKRLEEGTADVDLPLPGSAGAAGAAGVASDQEGAGKTVMVVESKIEMQDDLRERLRKRGYRVLIIGNAERAVARFNEYDPPPADCVVFSAPELGESALQAFNTFASLDYTKHIPAILLIDRKQAGEVVSANLNDHRIMLTMPLKVRELRETLLKLLTPQPSNGA